MSFVDDLLDQARHLLTLDSRRPKQASLRRAVSAAYYALFHEVVGAAAATVLLGERSGPSLDSRLRRVATHAAIKKAAGWFLPGGPQPAAITRVLRATLPDPDLVRICQTLVDLQGERHRADYDLASPFVRADAGRRVSDAQNAVDDLRRLPQSDSRRVFLLGCVLGELLTKNP